jgi:hypothetical protein
MLVVLRGVFVQDREQAPWPRNQHSLSHPPTGVARIHPLGKSVRRWTARQDLHYLDPGTGQHRAERSVNCPARSPDWEPEPTGTLLWVHQQVPCLLHRPRAVRVRGRT